MRDFEIGKVILLVDSDETSALLLMQRISRERAYRVFHASDSYAALKFTQYFKPHLFILGHCLPSLNGIELYDRLHLRRELQSIPALLMGQPPLPYAEMTPRKIVGACKPFDFSDLLQKIDKLLRSSSAL
ncbi:MAG TPA: response regulator [Ktedonosporobacter sp.]|jgi:DNA-binding response OmpR family regulator|nr:response regulator [Ktedonosporobacter sp.]